MRAQTTTVRALRVAGHGLGPVSEFHQGFTSSTHAEGRDRCLRCTSRNALFTRRRGGGGGGSVVGRWEAPAPHLRLHQHRGCPIHPSKPIQGRQRMAALHGGEGAGAIRILIGWGPSRAPGSVATQPDLPRARAGARGAALVRATRGARRRHVLAQRTRSGGWTPSPPVVDSSTLNAISPRRRRGAGARRRKNCYSLRRRKTT